jgi:hypothetical protein
MWNATTELFLPTTTAMQHERVLVWKHAGSTRDRATRSLSSERRHHATHHAPVRPRAVSLRIASRSEAAAES